MNINTIIWLFVINLSMFILFYFASRRSKYLFLFYLLAIAFFLYKLPSYKTLLYFVLPSFLIVIIINIINYKKEEEGIFNIVIDTKKGKRKLKDFIRGVLIFGSSGSGKTESVIYNFFYHFKKFQFSGCLYDYKNGELTEMILGLFDNVEIIAPHDPTISARVNFIKPEILIDETDINEISKVLIMNLIGSLEKLICPHTYYMSFVLYTGNSQGKNLIIPKCGLCEGNTTRHID